MTNRPVSPLKWALIETTMTAIGTAATAGATLAAVKDAPVMFKMAQAAESGEAGESGSESQTGSDAEFLADIGFIRGHLLAGYTLF